MNPTTVTAGRAVRRALLAALRRRADGPESERMTAVEALRAELLGCGMRIERIDYGAGEATPLSSRAHHTGVTVSHTIGDFCRSSSLPPVWCRFLFHVVRELRPMRALELGTALGLSAAYQGAALELNGQGRLVTVEGARPLAELAERNLARLDVERVDVVTGRFMDALPAVVDDLRPLDFAYIDGHHDGRATRDYFEVVLSAVTGPALVVFDDIGISAGMRQAWTAIRRHPRVGAAIDLRKLGVCEVP
jgi:predicted O-methyltransferase YrrM